MPTRNPGRGIPRLEAIDFDADLPVMPAAGNVLSLHLLILTLVSQPAASATVAADANTMPVESSTTSITPGPNDSVASLLERASALHADLEYEEVLPFVEAVLDRPDATMEQRLDAYLLQGSCLAVVGQPVDAEKSFRLLLRGRPDFEMPDSTSPKILAVFRKVQVEERAIREELEALERERMLKEMALLGSPPDRAVGGQPVKFSFALKDPRRVVAELRVHYRRQDQPAYSALALERNQFGLWTGEIPGEWTQNTDGFILEYFVRSSDEHGKPLLAMASEEAPQSLWVAPGTIEVPKALHEYGWFWVGLAGTVILSSVAGFIIYDSATSLPDSDLGNFGQ